MCSTGSRWLPPLLAAVLLCGLGEPGYADAFDDARRAFREGQAAYEGERYDEAAESYLAAYRLMRSPLLFFNIAQARRLQYQQSGDHRHLVEARRYYQRFMSEAEPRPSERAQAEANLREVDTAAIDEARKQFEAAEKAMRLSRFADAIEGYEAAYDLSGRPGILFNLAQAERKQFAVDGGLERLSRAENMIITFRRESPDQVSPDVIEEILVDIRSQRAEYHRKREAEARSKEPGPMREARQAYERGDAVGALAALAVAEKLDGNERLTLLQLYRLRGQAAAMTGDASTAETAFRYYLALEPAADGTGLREEAMPAFEAAREFWKDKPRMKLEHLPPGTVAPGKPVAIPVRIAADPLAMIARREVRYRKQGSDAWEQIALADAEQAARLPPQPLPLTGKEYRVEYVVIARDARGGTLDMLGTDNAPLAFLVSEDAIVRPPPIYKRWWFWAAAGAVAVTTVTTVIIATDDGLPDLPEIGEFSRGVIRW